MDWSKKNSLEAFITTRINDNHHKKSSYEPNIIESAEDFNQLDFLIALGGDGTILSAARAVGSRQTPMIGIHLGELGFLAEVTIDEMFSRLDQIAKGNFSTQPRMVLKATLSKNGTNKIDERKIEKSVQDIFDLSPRGIREHLKLTNAIYVPTSAYGHFGREPSDQGHFTWEKTDLVDSLKSLL